MKKNATEPSEEEATAEAEESAETSATTQEGSLMARVHNMSRYLEHVHHRSEVRIV